jgi:hypothetical protein
MHHSYGQSIASVGTNRCLFSTTIPDGRFTLTRYGCHTPGGSNRERRDTSDTSLTVSDRNDFTVIPHALAYVWYLPTNHRPVTADWANTAHGAPWVKLSGNRGTLRMYDRKSLSSNNSRSVGG